MAEPSRNQIANAVEAIIKAQTWDERKHIVEVHRDELLTNTADQLLAHLLEQYRNNANATRILQEHRDLLVRCRIDGIEAAFAGRLLPEELLALLLEIQQLRSPSEMSRRATLCQAALRLFHRDTQPRLWAHLQIQLAISLAQNPQGERADNLEQAIHHYQQALQVLTQPAFPIEWAMTQHDLALAYSERIRGERADNLEQAIRHCQQALEVRTRQDFPEDWAQTQGNLALAYNKRIRGERADNLEQAITRFKQVLEVYTRQAFPEGWAMTQHNLALAYRERIRGERADNLEQAIHHCQHALEVRTRQDFPEGWAQTQNNLGSAYAERIRGERADNLEQEIQHYQQALQVLTRPAFPIEWAMAQNDLGVAYRERIQGERADNLEQAIQHCQQALQVLTRPAFPIEWAMAQSNLANAYSERIRGERADNLEQAIHRYQQALEIYTRQDLPEGWAQIQNNLGVAYRERIRGERADNLEQAIHHCQHALEVRTRQDFPEDWAWTQSNLGVAYHERIQGERADNLEQAIHHCQQALQVLTRPAFPIEWAKAQNNLALAYSERIRGEHADNLEQAIHHCQQALEVRTRQELPEDWAQTQNNLALAYSERIRGERADNLKQAILHYQHALEVRTPLSFPQDCRDTAYALGCLLYDERRFSEAQRALDTAHQAVEALRGEVQRDIAKRSLSEENADLYARLVSCCLKEGDEAAAFAYATAGKGRAFVDLLATARFDLSAASANDPTLAEDLRIARDLRQQIDNLLALLTGESESSLASSSPVFSSGTLGRTPRPLDVLRAQLSAMQAQEAHQWEGMAYKYPALTATQKAPILSVEQARTLAAELNATLVEYYQHAEGWCAFVVTPHAMYYVPLPLMNNDLLELMAKWVLRLENRIGLNPLSYKRLFEWHDAVIAPVEVYLPQNQPIILAPFGALYVLSLAAARHPQTGRYIAEDYQLAFVPSLSALHTMWEQVHSTIRDKQVVPHRLLSVAYPGVPGSSHYLPNVLLEAHAIASFFAQVTPLYQEEATPDAVLAYSVNQDVVHFGCHGWFDAERPEQSGLMLAGGWLTVQRIITELHLERARLATLGACLSGRAAPQRGDEHVGLLQAILTTGVQTVVASLWPVDDAATRALFEAFYAELVAGRSPARALQEAALHVRKHPGWEHPYYWAAFQVSGLAHGTPKSVQIPLSIT
jgi:tetratricopeptide (TPR) repeat protein